MICIMIFAYRRFTNFVLCTSVNSTSQVSVQYGFSKQTFTLCNGNCTLTGGLFIRVVYIINSMCGRFSIVVSLARSFIVFFFTIFRLLKRLCRPSTLLYLPQCYFKVFVTVIYYIFCNWFHKSSSRSTTFSFSHRFLFDYCRIIHESRYSSYHFFLLSPIVFILISWFVRSEVTIFVSNFICPGNLLFQKLQFPPIRFEFCPHILHTAKCCYTPWKTLYWGF